jgi:hypothetical protein
MYYVKYCLWRFKDGTREEKTFEGHYGEPSPIDCVNAIVYEIRGKKTDWELAYVDEITEVDNHE